MDERHDNEARMPREARSVSEQDILENLNRCFWEMERQRAQEELSAQ